MLSRIAPLVLLLLAACQQTPAASEAQVSPELQFEVIRLENAEAEELSRSLIALVEDASEGGVESKIKVSADQRTNSLLLQAPADDMVRLRNLIVLLDVKP